MKSGGCKSTDAWLPIWDGRPGIESQDTQGNSGGAADKKTNSLPLKKSGHYVSLAR